MLDNPGKAESITNSREGIHLYKRKQRGESWIQEIETGRNRLKSSCCQISKIGRTLLINSDND